jgi:hypothetical protein
VAPATAVCRAGGFRYDRAAGAVRALRPLWTGALVRRPPEFALARIRPGETLSLQTQVGPVIVQRDVAVVRPAHAGRAVVTTSGGEVLAVALPAETGQ